MGRVVITGQGVISGCGDSAAHMENYFKSGESAIGDYASEEVQLVMKSAAPVKDFDPGDHFEARHIPQLDPCTQFALVSARQAVENAKLTISDDESFRAGVVYGTGIGGLRTQYDVAERIIGSDKGKVHPLTVAKGMISSAASQIAMANNAKGPSFAVSSACASATHAIGVAFHLIRSGAADIMISGGSEHVFVNYALLSWDAMRVVAPDTCRPFSKTRKGLILGEGAGAFVLESLDHAEARGAQILAEIVGFGMSSDAGDIFQPDSDGMAMAMRGALADSGVNEESVDYINAHGTGTALNDARETQAIHQVFEAHAQGLSISSTKSIHGHAMGASGALETVAVLYALRNGMIPPTANFEEADPECDLDCTPNKPLQRDVKVALNNSFAFGGLNASLALKRFDG